MCGTRLRRSGQGKRKGATKEKDVGRLRDICDVECKTLSRAQKVNPTKRRNSQGYFDRQTNRFHSLRTEGTTGQECGESEVAEEWINGHHARGQQDKAKIGAFQKTLHSWWRRKAACLVGMIDDYVKHISREHTQEADHLTNLGAEGQRKITVEKVRELEGGTRISGTEQKDRRKERMWSCDLRCGQRPVRPWQLKLWGASVLTGVLDLVLGKISVENINQWINEIMKSTHRPQTDKMIGDKKRTTTSAAQLCCHSGGRRARAKSGGIRFRRSCCQSQDRNACSGSCFQHR